MAVSLTGCPFLCWFSISVSSVAHLAYSIYIFIYTIRSEDNWKLFSPKPEPPYPSLWTHSSYVFGVDRVEGLWTTEKSQFRECFCQKRNSCHPTRVYPPTYTHRAHRPPTRTWRPTGMNPKDRRHGKFADRIQLFLARHGRISLRLTRPSMHAADGPMGIVRVYVLIYWLIINEIPLFCFGKIICGIPNHITQVLLLCTPAMVFLIKLYTEFLTVNLYYKERR
jgi:hypothetical protein